MKGHEEGKVSSGQLAERRRIAPTWSGLRPERIVGLQARFHDAGDAETLQKSRAFHTEHCKNARF